jgi:hypothetical protein
VDEVYRAIVCVVYGVVMERLFTVFGDGVCAGVVIVCVFWRYLKRDCVFYTGCESSFYRDDRNYHSLRPREVRSLPFQVHLRVFYIYKISRTKVSNNGVTKWRIVEKYNLKYSCRPLMILAVYIYHSFFSHSHNPRFLA